MNEYWKFIIKNEPQVNFCISLDCQQCLKRVYVFGQSLDQMMMITDMKIGWSVLLVQVTKLALLV